MNSSVSVRELEREQSALSIYDPAGKLDRRYEHWLSRTNDPSAAATLVLAEVQSAEKPATNGRVGNRRKSDAINPPQVAKELRVSPDTVLNWIRSKQLKAANIATGNRPRYVIQRSELERFLLLRSI